MLVQVIQLMHFLQQKQVYLYFTVFFIKIQKNKLNKTVDRSIRNHVFNNHAHPVKHLQSEKTVQHLC